MVSSIGGLGHVDFLKASRQCAVFLEYAAVLLKRGRTNTAKLAGGKHGFDQVGCVHDAAGSRSRPDDRMDFVDKEDGAGLLVELPEHTLQALLEITPILGARKQRTQIERIDSAAFKHVGHVAVDNHFREALGDRGLAYTRLANVQGVVLSSTTQDLNGAFDLVATANQRVYLAEQRLLIQVGGVGLQRRLAGALAGLSRRRLRVQTRPPSSLSCTLEIPCEM